MPDCAHDLVQYLDVYPGIQICVRCGRFLRGRRCPHCGQYTRDHYVHGHLQCMGCGRSVNDCCEGERGDA